jgi:hypothetical protein
LCLWLSISQISHLYNFNIKLKMLSKILQRGGLMKMRSNGINLAKLMPTVQARAFGAGPYNPLHYKTLKVPEEMPSTEDYYATLKSHHSTPAAPVYNMRHIHPVR